MSDRLELCDLLKFLQFLKQNVQCTILCLHNKILAK